jgi:sugar lactone lactonase YvrE
MYTATFSWRPGAGHLHRGLGGQLLLTGGAWARPLRRGPASSPHHTAQRLAGYLRAGLVALAFVLLALAPAAAQTYTITTVAGNGTAAFGGDGGAATSAQLNLPYGVAIDGSGNVFIADLGNSRIRKVSAATGVITTLAGTGGLGFSGDGGAATSARFYGPQGVAIDGSGNIFIADLNNQRIRRVSAATGVITTVAGTGVYGFSGDGGAATNAQLGQPSGVVVDGSGNIFFADQNNHRIRKVSAATGVITTVAGSSTAGFSGDGGVATSARLNQPKGVVVDNRGNVFFADAVNNRIRQLTPVVAPTLTGLNPTSGLVGTSVTLTGTGFTSGSTVSFNGTAATSVTFTSGTSLTATVPTGATTGNVTVTAATGTSNGLSFTVTVLPDQTYTITTFAGTPRTSGFSGDGGAATSARLYFPTGVAVDGSGNVFIADWLNYRIRKVSATTGVITTVAGNGTAGFSGDGGPATSARLGEPQGMAVDGSGNLFITDYGNSRIRKLNVATGVITTVVGTASFSTPGFSGDGGPATSARLNYPSGVAIDGGGNIFIADRGNRCIRKVSAATGVITTVAGNGTFTSGFSGDGGAATSAQFDEPRGVAVDGSGNLFIADVGNHRIRKVNGATGVITTVAGTGTAGFSGDGGPATNAQLDIPEALSLDGSGNIFIADRGVNNHRIRKVNAATGVITTVAGTGTAGFSGDGGPATSARFDDTRSLAVGGSGKVFIADLSNACVRLLTPAGPLSALPALSAAAVQLYPNPARGAVTVLVPTGIGAGQVQAVLLNALGQPVRRQVAAMDAPFTVETAGLAPGVYTLRLQAGTATLAKRLVVQ